MQLCRIFQRGVGFVFLIVIDQTKRVVQVGDLANVQFIDVATRSGSDIATPVKVAHGHQGWRRQLTRKARVMLPAMANVSSSSLT
jgi:hypothetical protein